MRNVELFTNADASTQLISEPVNLDQRAQWKLYVYSTGLDGTPQLFIEDNTSGSKCITPTGTWTEICNPFEDYNYFELSDTTVTIEKKDFKANWFRIRIEPSGNTTGTIDVRLSYKTFP